MINVPRIINNNNNNKRRNEIAQREGVEWGRVSSSTMKCVWGDDDDVLAFHFGAIVGQIQQNISINCACDCVCVCAWHWLLQIEFIYLIWQLIPSNLRFKLD